MAERSLTRWWQSVPRTTEETGQVVTHPRATLDAQAARLLKSRQEVMQLDIEIQALRSSYQATLSDIEAHYSKELDSVQSQYAEKSGALSERYASAHASLMREQGAMAEQLKGVDCRAEFVNHWPVPGDGGGDDT